MRRKLLMILCAGLLMGVGVVADEGYQLWINGARSKFAPVKVKDQVVVPLNFPVQDAEMEWTVSVRRDEKTRRVEVKMAPNRPKLRGDNPCHICVGTGLCQTCYPAGSGSNTAGQADYTCTGTGKCWYCKGVGSW